MQQRARELRREMMPTEKKLRMRLRAGQLNGAHLLMSDAQRRWATWRRKQPAVGTCIVDFFCAKSKLVIEVDGDTHFGPDQAKYDRARIEWLSEQKDYRVIRFTDGEVHRNLEAVLEKILSAL